MTGYLDHASAWPLSDAVRAEMDRWTAHVGSPMALHEAARGPADAIAAAREQVAALTAWSAECVIFTAGPTEARNLAIKGSLAAGGVEAPVIVADPLAHISTLAVARTLTRRTGEMRLSPVDSTGRVSTVDLATTVTSSAGGGANDEGKGSSIRATTGDMRAGAPADVVVITHGQAEVGTLQEAAALAAAVRAACPDAVIVLDAEETAGLIPLDDGLGADLVVIGGRTLGAPPWTGALLVRAGTRLHPLVEGGLEEGGKRGGAHDVPGIAALGVAAREARAGRDARVATMRRHAATLADGMLAVPGTRLNGPHVGERLPGHVQVSAEGVEGEAVALAMAARGVAVSPGSACTFGAGKASPVLEAMGLNDQLARSAVLVTAGPGTTDAEVAKAIAAYAAAVESLRGMAPG
ncbi:MAG: aminotransferase class V-fold PLP-dependent enzyme [Actinobacteria bacterium]|nr:aminotransferase class V-fold PLP-dependent enzyme [Actinomycetota bacterium]MBM3697192.1 aminotransferase class V-fold PLP-dependent enzyme [Actinomycetota bacterium]